MNIGLFGYTNGATIENIGLENCDITGQHFVGGLMGFIFNGSVISNSYVTGSVSGEWYVGGLVGINKESDIRNSYVTGSVSGRANVGGLVGLNETETSYISTCYSTGDVTRTGGSNTFLVVFVDIIIKLLLNIATALVMLFMMAILTRLIKVL